MERILHVEHWQDDFGRAKDLGVVWALNKGTHGNPSTPVSRDDLTARWSPATQWERLVSPPTKRLLSPCDGGGDANKSTPSTFKLATRTLMRYEPNHRSRVRRGPVRNAARGGRSEIVGFAHARLTFPPCTDCSPPSTQRAVPVSTHSSVSWTEHPHAARFRYTRQMSDEIVDSERKRQHAESHREKAEDNREDAEDVRRHQEQLREVAEMARKAGEAARISAEDARMAAEEARTAAAAAVAATADTLAATLKNMESVEEMRRALRDFGVPKSSPN